MTEEPDLPADGSPLGRAISRLQQPVALGDRAIQRAMAEVAVPPRRHAQLLWVGAGIAAGLALFAGAGSLRSRGNAGHDITFVLHSPARQVTLIGDFNDWDRTATPLRERAGIWSTTVALKPGRYRYAFVLDGTRLAADPGAPAALDEFGTSTSAITVGR